MPTTTVLWTGKTTTALKVRSSPSSATEDNLIGVLQAGETVKVIGTTVNWLEIDWVSKAYVHGNYVKRDEMIVPEKRVIGIDVSRWNDVNSTPQQVNFVKAKVAGAEFVFIKSSQANWQDEDILYNWKNYLLIKKLFHYGNTMRLPTK